MGEYDFGPMYRSYSGMWMNEPADNMVELSDEQKRKKAEEETFRNLPWYMKYDKQISEGILGNEDHPTAAGYLKKAIDVPLETIGKGRDVATSAIAGVPTQPFMKSVEGVFRGPDPGDIDPTIDPFKDLPADVDDPRYGGITTELLKKSLNAASDPTQLAFMAGGPAGSIAGAALAPGMISAGGEQIGKGISDIESDNMGAGVNNIAGGLFDVGMGGLGIKHPLEAVAKPLAERFPNPLQRPIEFTETPASLERTWKEGELTPIYLGDELGFSGKPSAERGAVGDISKLNTFEDSQFRKYGKEWRSAQSPEEASYHKQLMSGAAPTPPALENLASAIDDPSLAPRIESLVKEGYDPGRAIRIAKAEMSEIPEEHLTPEDVSEYMSREQAKEVPMEAEPLPEELDAPQMYNEPHPKPIIPEAIPEVEPLIGTDEPMAAEPLRRGRPKKAVPPDMEVYDIEKENPPGMDLSGHEISLIDKISNAQDVEQIQSLKNEIKNTGELVAYEKALKKAQLREQRGQEANDVRRMQEAYNLKREMIKVQLREKAKREKTALSQKSETNPSERSLLDDITDLPKTLRAGFDVSFPMRQGLFLLNRPEGLKGVGRGFKSFAEREHQNVQADLAERPNAQLYKDFGLQQVEYDPKMLEQKSEQFPATAMAEKIPGLKQSERIYIDQGNLMRANVFDKLAEKWKAQGKTPENSPQLYSATAKYLNVLTGRDTLGKRFAQAGNVLNKVFFSPRFIKSRLQLMNPAFYAHLPRELQMEAIRDVGGTLGTLGILMGGAVAAARQAGYSKDEIDIGADPRATNFGKLKVGHVSYDFFSSLLPLIRTSARLATGTKVTPSGESQLGGLSGRSLLGVESDLPKAPFGASTGSELMTLGEGKLAPVPTAAKGLLSGQGFAGEEYGMGEAARDLIAPMSIADFVGALRDYDAGTAAMTLPSLLGVGVQTDIPPEKIGSSSSSGGGSSEESWSTGKSRKSKKRKAAW